MLIVTYNINRGIWGKRRAAVKRLQYRRARAGLSEETSGGKPTFESLSVTTAMTSCEVREGGQTLSEVGYLRPYKHTNLRTCDAEFTLM